jgi:hypothetical protein
MLWLQQRGLNLKTNRPTLVFFLGPTKPLQSYNRQARTGDTALVKSREIGAKHYLGDRGGGKDDRKENTLAPLG